MSSSASERDQPESSQSPGRAPEASSERGKQPAPISARGSEPPLVLVAEDEEPIAAALTIIIEDAGYTPLVAAHGRAALELVRERRPALVITDLMMPYLDGADLIEAIHDDARQNNLPPPPTILMTAAGLRRAQETGADAVLRKPFNIEDVEALLRRFLGTSRRQTGSGELLP
jgi:CheY-like chemotaxis protein